MPESYDAFQLLIQESNIKEILENIFYSAHIDDLEDEASFLLT